VVAVSSEGDGKDSHPGLRLSRGEGNRPDGNYTFSGPWTVKGKGKCPEMETELEGVLAWGDSICRADVRGSLGETAHVGVHHLLHKKKCRGTKDGCPADDLTPSLRAEQGWAGAISLPRELFWQSRGRRRGDTQYLAG
jgi:hypothetical protein